MKKVLFLLCFLTNLANAQVTFESLTLPSQVVNKNLYAISNQGANLFIAGDGCLLKITESNIIYKSFKFI